jgi:ATP-binding cassette, subfamily B, bacterial
METLFPQDQVNKDPARRKIQNALSILFSFIKKEKKSIKYLYLYAALAGIISLSLPLGIQTIINYVLAGRLSTSWVILVVLITFAVFLLGITRIAQLSIVDSLQRKLFIQYAIRFRDSIRSKPEMAPDKIMNQSQKFMDIITLQKSFSKLITDFTGKLLQALAGLVLLAMYHPMFIVFSVMVIILVYLSLKFTWLSGFQTAREESNYKFKTADNLRSLAISYTKETEEKLNSNITNYAIARTQHFVILNRQAWIGVIIKVILTFIMLVIGSYLLVNQSISLGQFLASEILIITLLDAIEKLILTVESLYDCGISIEKLNEINEN